jgi:hypothetical protein
VQWESDVAVQGGQAKFVEGNLFRHLTVMALSSSVGLIAVFVVDLINMVYISWLQDHVLTAALGYAGAVLFFTTSFGIGLSIGVSALVSQAVGQRDPKLAQERVTEGLVLSLVLGTLFSALVFVLLPEIVSLLGATGRTAEETLLFLRIYTASQPLLIVAIVGAAVLRSYGEARRSMMVTVWGAVFLAALDPVLILWADWGLTGAALAGAGSRTAMAVMALWPVRQRIGGFSRVSGAGLRFGLAPLLTIAFPAILTQLATPVGQAFVTRMVAEFGEAAVAGMAIAGRLTPGRLRGDLRACQGPSGRSSGRTLAPGRLDRVRRGVPGRADLHRAGDPCWSRPCCSSLRAPSSPTLFQAEGLKSAIWSICSAGRLHFAVVLQRHDLCRQCGLQQPWPAVLVHRW